MGSEISQSQTNPVSFHLCVESEKQNKQLTKPDSDIEYKLVVSRDSGGMSEIGERD